MLRRSLTLVVGTVLIVLAVTLAAQNPTQPQPQTAIGTGSCAAVGTAANPSIVACVGAGTGIFACDVAASGGTCVVQTEFVRDRDVILVQPISYAGTPLGVTCNTAPAAVPAITVASVVNGGSGSGTFTVNMPTFAVNPMCYSYQIIGR